VVLPQPSAELGLLGGAREPAGDVLQPRCRQGHGGEQQLHGQDEAVARSVIEDVRLHGEVFNDEVGPGEVTREQPCRPDQRRPSPGTGSRRFSLLTHHLANPLAKGGQDVFAGQWFEMYRPPRGIETRHEAKALCPERLEVIVTFLQAK
jgi:hypothetical protein